MRSDFGKIGLKHVTHVHQLCEHSFDLVIECAADCRLKTGFEGSNHCTHVHLTSVTLGNEGLLQLHYCIDDNFQSHTADLHRCSRRWFNVLEYIVVF
jgi:hypothetical protein